MLSPGASFLASCWPEEKSTSPASALHTKEDFVQQKEQDRLFTKTRRVWITHTLLQNLVKAWRRTGGLLLFTKQGGCESLSWWRPSAKPGLFCCQRRGGLLLFTKVSCCRCPSTKPGESRTHHLEQLFLAFHHIQCNEFTIYSYFGDFGFTLDFHVKSQLYFRESTCSITKGSH